MKRILLLTILSVFVLGIFQGNLYSLITSRIEGVVKDKDTGEPLRGVCIELFECNFRAGLCKDCCDSAGSEITDKNGYFKFDYLSKAEYFMFIVRRDYLPYGSIDKTAFRYMLGGAKSEYLGDFAWMYKSSLSPFFKNYNHKRTFVLKEGEIKHFEIKLEKAAQLEVNLKIKTKDGIRDVNSFDDDASYALYGKEINDVPNKWSMDFSAGHVIKNPYLSRCLKAYGLVTATVRTKGFFDIKVGEVNLQKGVKSKIEYTFDFTKGPLIHGIVNVMNDNIKSLAAVTIIKKKTMEILPNERSFSKSRNFGEEFWYGGLEPGEYEVTIGYLHKLNDKLIYKEIKKSVNIISNEIVELSFTL